MTDTERPADLIERAATDLIPQLVERLERHGLGEIEVAHGDLRLRVASGSHGAVGTASATAGGAGAPPPPTHVSPAPDAGSASLGVSAPAVGFFVYADGLGPGLGVEKGDALGHVEMLGVRHDVRAPRRGTVRHLVAESGEAVEYGQVVVELEPAEATR
jgi:acetyl-CoA carboxylase biotin carboxyl carrier protein